MQGDFYLLTTADRPATWAFAARLIEKIYHLKHRIQIHLPAVELTEFNQYLWSYRADSFLPHDIVTEKNIDLPIILHDRAELLTNRPLLINLSDQIIESYPETLERIVEIVSQDPAQLAKSRERYRAYQKLGFTLQTHRVA